MDYSDVNAIGGKISQRFLLSDEQMQSEKSGKTINYYPYSQTVEVSSSRLMSEAPLYLKPAW